MSVPVGFVCFLPTHRRLWATTQPQHAPPCRSFPPVVRRVEEPKLAARLTQEGRR
jgi:hypothetical protein